MEAAGLASVRPDRRYPSAFYALALAFAVVAALGAARGVAPLMFLYMFTPLLAVLVLHATQAGRVGFQWAGLRRLTADLSLHRPGFRGWPIAILLPPILFGLVTLAVVGTGVAQYHMVAALGPLWLLGVGFSVVSALGEEAGWRGYLLPSLLQLGIWPAMLLTGLLHGLWHFPVILLTPYYHSAGSPWIVLPEFLVVLTLAGVIYGYLRLWTGSLWPPILLHASINESLAFYEKGTEAADPVRLEYWGAESGGFTIVAVSLVVAWIALRWRPLSGTDEPGLASG
jgi:membrane protease YdiL (CAAX protease family)